MDLPRQKVRGLASRGGTIIGTSRTNPFDGPNGGPENIEIMMERHGIDAIIAIGGEGTLAGANVWRMRVCPSSVSPRPLITICAPLTTPSVLTPLFLLRPRQWTAFVPPANRITAAWSPK